MTDAAYRAGAGWAKLLVVLVASGLIGCAPKQPLVAPAQRVLPEEAALQQALQAKSLSERLARLEELARRASGPIAEEARMRHAMLRVQSEGVAAAREALAVLAQHPAHALAPRLWLALAKAYWDAGMPRRALDAAAAVLRHPWRDEEARSEARRLAEKILPRIDDEALLLRWRLSLLAAARSEEEKARLSAQLAASIAPSSLIALHEIGALPAQALLALDQAFVRRRLLDGDRATAQAIVSLAERKFPGSPQLAAMQAWLAADAAAARIGLLLPLSGPMRAKAEAFLLGARIAAQQARATLIVEDTQQDASLAPAAAMRLRASGVQVAIGPWTEEAVVAVQEVGPPAPVWLALARGDPSLDASSLPLAAGLDPKAETEAIASEMAREGIVRVLVLATEDAADEAIAFAEAWQRIGGEVVEFDELPQGVLDVRDLLLQIRARTDDEELLYALDEDLSLFSPDRQLAPRLPPGFDAIYIAAPGKVVYLLAAQLAWAGLGKVPLYGSTRWDDGHLLDDRGRYLAFARFGCHPFAHAKTGEAARWREEWLLLVGKDRVPSRWAAWGYDLVRIVADLIGRFGLQGDALAQALQDPAGFEGITGRIFFAPTAHRAPAFCAVRRGRIVMLEAR